MNTAWTCRARKKGAPFPTFIGPYTRIELLSWQVSGTVLLRGPQQLVSDWAATHDHTAPQAPLPGIYLIDEATLFYIDARGQLVSGAAQVLRSLPPSSRAVGQLTEESARQVLAEQQRVFVLSDLGPFQVTSLLLKLFGIRSRPADTVRFR